MCFEDSDNCEPYAVRDGPKAVRDGPKAGRGSLTVNDSPNAKTKKRNETKANEQTAQVGKSKSQKDCKILTKKKNYEQLKNGQSDECKKQLQTEEQEAFGDFEVILW